MKHKFLLIGWDSADWDIINPLIDSGKMPNLEKFINEGISGKISTLDPPLSPILWTSIATGKRPYKHGVLGFGEPDANGEQLQTVKVTSRKVKAVWNILQQNGLKSHVIGWWPSHPAEPISGIMVSNQFAKAPFNNPEKWTVTEGAVNRKELEADMTLLRVHPAEMTENHLLPFVENAGSVQQLKDMSLWKIAANLAETATTQNVATFVMDLEQDWDFMAVYFESIDLICHQFMKFMPPKLSSVSEESYQLYKNVVDGFYIFHDRMLGYMLEHVPQDCTVMIISDHGFKSGDKRLLQIPKEPAGIAHEHSYHGFVAIKGPGIKKDERIYGTSILDITPTILHHFGIAVGKDMDGKPLLNIYETPKSVSHIPSWESVAGNTGQHPDRLSEQNVVEFRDAAHLDHLEELGYVDTGDTVEANDKVKMIQRESIFYLGRSYHHAHLYHEALEIFQKINEEQPATLRYQKYLADTLLHLHHLNDFKALMSEINIDLNIWNDDWVNLQLAYFNKSGNYDKTISFYSRNKKKISDRQSLLLLVIKAFFGKGDHPAARMLCNKLLDLSPNNPQAYFFMGMLDKQAGDYESAADNFLNSIGLVYFQPKAHYNLALVLRELKLHNDAVAALKISLQQAPRWKLPKQMLEEVYIKDLNDEAGLEAFINEFSHLELPLIYIVSGLPRSGTSMMMQTLETCGLLPLTDGKRKADESNQKGYYELEAVKKLHLDNKWLASAEGKVLKVVSPQLPYLPDRFRYKIIYMTRNIDQVVKSQVSMLQRMGKLPSGSEPLFMDRQLKRDHQRAREWMENRNHVAYLDVNYSDWLEDFDNEWEKLASFLGLKIDLKMIAAAIVDKKLFRER